MSLAAWALFGLGALTCLLLARLTGGRVATFAGFVDRLTARRAAYVAAYAGWIFVGWHLFVR